MRESCFLHSPSINQAALVPDGTFLLSESGLNPDHFRPAACPDRISPGAVAGTNNDLKISVLHMSIADIVYHRSHKIRGK